MTRATVRMRDSIDFFPIGSKIGDEMPNTVWFARGRKFICRQEINRAWLNTVEAFKV